jgi:hypothetical protein
MAKKGNRAQTLCFFAFPIASMLLLLIGTDLHCRYDGARELSPDLFSLVDPIDPDDLVNIPELNMTPMMNPANEGSSC